MADDNELAYSKGNAQERVEKTDRKGTKHSDTESVENKRIPRQSYPSTQLVSGARKFDSQQMDAVPVPPSTKASDEEECRESRHSSDDLVTRQQIASHSPVMKELIEKFEMRKVENKNAARKTTRHRGQPSSLMARDAWSPKRSTARLDIDPCAVTSSSFSDLSNSANSARSKPSLARSSAALLILNEGEGDTGSKRHPCGSDARSADAITGSFPDRSRSELSLSGAAGQGDNIDNATNNKDIDFLEVPSPEKSRLSENEAVGLRGPPRKKPQKPCLSIISENVESGMSANNSIPIEEAGMNGNSPTDDQWPQHISLRGLVKKRGNKFRMTGRSNSSEHGMFKDGQMFPNFKSSRSTSPGMPPMCLPRMSTNASKKGIGSVSPQNLFPCQEDPKISNISPRATINGSPAMLRDAVVKNSSIFLSTSRSKPSMTEESMSSKATLWSSLRRQARTEKEESKKNKYRKVSSTDRYLMFLKRNTPPPKLEKSKDSLAVMGPTPVSHVTSLAATPLTQKPPKQEYSLHRLGSNLTGSSNNSGRRESSKGDKQDPFRVNIHRRARSVAMPHAGTLIKRSLSASSRKRPQSVPTKAMSTSTSSICVSPLGSQVSAHVPNSHGSTVGKRPRPNSAIMAKYQRIPFPALGRVNPASSGSSTMVETAKRALKPSERVQMLRSSNKEKQFRASPTKTPDEFLFRHDTSATSSASPTLFRHPRQELQALQKINAKGLDGLKLQAKDHSGDDFRTDTPCRIGGDKMWMGHSPRSIDSPLSLLADVEMADTDLIPKHLRDTHRGHKSHPSLASPRDDFVLFLSSSEEDSSYLSIEDQLRKIKTKRFLQMLHGSTLMDSIAAYQSTPMAKAEANDQSSTSSKAGKSDATPPPQAYGGPRLMARMKESKETPDFPSPKEISFAMGNTPGLLQDQRSTRDSSPEPLQFPSKQFDTVSGKEMLLNSGGVVTRPSPLRTNYRLTKPPGARAMADLPIDARHTDNLPGPKISCPDHKADEVPYHFGYSMRTGLRARSPGKSPEKQLPEVDTVSLGKTSDRSKKRKMAGGKTVKKKKQKKANKELEKFKRDVPEEEPSISKTELKASPSKRRRSPKKLEMAEQMSPPKPPESSPRSNPVIYMHQRSLSSEKVHRHQSSPIHSQRTHDTHTCTKTERNGTDVQRKESLKWKFTIKPVRRLTREATDQWPIKSRIPLVHEPSQAPTKLQCPGEMWAKYRRLGEDFREPGHPCKIPISRTFRYMLKVAPYQEWRLHSWNFCAGVKASEHSLARNGTNQWRDAVSGKRPGGKAMNGNQADEEDSVITTATKIRYWRAGPLRMPHILYTGVGLLSVGMAYVVMWLATCRGNKVDVFCSEGEDEVSCLVSP